MSENLKDRKRIEELTALLNRASEAYYSEDREIMSNLEYDKLYDELRELETRTGIVLSSSPTANVGYTAADFLEKEKHETPMLSLDKTKDRDTLKEWLGDKEGLLSWKLDGLTVVLTYRDGKLFKAVTRGNGETGEVVTENARTFRNIPLSVPFKGTLILRGEAVIKYSDFERINLQIEKEAVEKGDGTVVLYKNPRNLCSGSVRQLNNAVTAKRSVYFYAFTLVMAEGMDFRLRSEQLDFISSLGFSAVEYRRVNSSDIKDEIEGFAERIKDYDIPSDGLVLTFDDIEYGKSLGRTAKFPRDSIAFKWADEVQETYLREIEWSASRTGLINPVAVFDPVELEGTTVRRASVHNVSIVKELRLGIGDRISVYKANMIIPQIAENFTKSGNAEIPARCPVCGGQTEVRQENEAQVLICTNRKCPAKKIRSFSLFVSRNAMNIEGLSDATLEKFVSMGFIHEFCDIYRLDRYKEQIEGMEGFGAKSYANMASSINNSRKTVLSRVIYALGIPGIGAANARLLSRHFGSSLEKLRSATAEELSEVEGIGGVLADAVVQYFSDENNLSQLDRLVSELDIEDENTVTESEITGKTFAVTGAVSRFENRDALKTFIEARGGKVSSSVSSKTDYLINNDSLSGSSKNREAKKLNVPIINEDEFMEMAGE